MKGFDMRALGLTKSQILRRRDRFERELCLYGGFTHNVGKFGADQPPYMPELRALNMAVRKTYNSSMPKGADVDHMWPREVGVQRFGRRKGS